MKHKALELNLRQIMQGMEEFATFMSYKSNYEGLRILKVESQTTCIAPAAGYTTDNIVSIEHARSARSEAVNEVAVQKYH